MRILTFGAGVIGSVYAGKLQQAGNDVVLLARGRRLADLQQHRLVLEDAQSKHPDALAVDAVSEIPVGGRYDLAIVAVRSEQPLRVLPMLTVMTIDRMLFFGNTLVREAELARAPSGHG